MSVNDNNEKQITVTKLQTAAVKSATTLAVAGGGKITTHTAPSAIADNRVAHKKSIFDKRRERLHKGLKWAKQQPNEDEVSPQERQAIQSDVSRAVHGVQAKIAVVATDVHELVTHTARHDTEIAALAQILRQGHATGDIAMAKPAVMSMWTKLGFRVEEFSWENFEMQIGWVLNLVTFTDRLVIVRQGEKSASLFKTGTPVRLPMGVGYFAGMGEVSIVQTPPDQTAAIPDDTYTYEDPDYELPQVPCTITVRGAVRTSTAHKNVITGAARDRFHWAGTWMDLESLFDPKTGKWSKLTVGELLEELFEIPATELGVHENDEVIVHVQGVGVPDICSTMRSMLQLAGIKAVTAEGAVGAAAGYLLNKLVDYLLDGSNIETMAAIPSTALAVH